MSTDTPRPRRPGRAPMRRVRKEAMAHQPSPARDAQIVAPLNDGIVMLVMIQALIRLGLKPSRRRYSATSPCWATCGMRTRRGPLA